MEQVYISTSVPSNRLAVVARLLSQAGLDQWHVDAMFIAGESSEDFEAGVTVWQDEKSGPIGIQFHDVVHDRDLAGRVYSITKAEGLPFSFGMAGGFGHYTTYTELPPDPIDPRVIGVVRAFKKARKRA